MLTYVVTIAIQRLLRARTTSAACSGTSCSHSPGDVIFGCIIDRRPAGAINVVGVKESAGRQHAAGGRRLPDPGAAGARRLLPRPVDPEVAGRQRPRSGVAPTWKNFVLAIPIGMIAYTGIETISNMAEEAKDEATTIPAAIAACALAVFAIYFTLPAVALSALPVDRSRGRRVRDQAGPAARTRAARRRPVLGVVARSTSASLQHARRALRRPAGGDDPVPGHERGPDRRLAARLLDGHPPPVARRPAAAAPAVPHAVDRDHRLRRLRDPGHAPRPGRRSWATCTRSARCCRSRSPTWR